MILYFTYFEGERRTSLSSLNVADKPHNYLYKHFHPNCVISHTKVYLWQNMDYYYHFFILF